jgi:hypothetical protein
VVAVGRSSPLVTVIIPTHDHASTLDLSINSVLAQSVDSLELVVIGDGAGDDTRDVMAAITDPRIRFVDEPKSPSRSELTRHKILADQASEVVCYLGDDDLMLVDHVETMVDLLTQVDFAHPLPVCIDSNGMFAAHPADLSIPGYRRWHLNHQHNAISLTGVAHRLGAYRRLPFGWRYPPAGWHSDHYMWMQWFDTPGLTFATGERLTVLKFDASLRQGWTARRRRDELLEWVDRMVEPSFPSWLQDQLLAALQHSASHLRLLYSDLQDAFSEEQARHAEVASELATSLSRLQHLDTDISALWTQVHELESTLNEVYRLHHEQDELLKEMRATRTWRTHDRIIGSRLFTKVSTWRASETVPPVD